MLHQETFWKETSILLKTGSAWRWRIQWLLVPLGDNVLIQTNFYPPLLLCHQYKFNTVERPSSLRIIKIVCPCGLPKMILWIPSRAYTLRTAPLENPFKVHVLRVVVKEWICNKGKHNIKYIPQLFSGKTTRKHMWESFSFAVMGKPWYKLGFLVMDISIRF